MIALTLAVQLLSLHAAPPAKKEPESAAMKGLLKDAIKVESTDATADGGTAEKPAGPDVSKMAFNPDNIKKVVAYYQPQIQACYEETLAVKDKAVEGKLVTSWVINADGMATKPKIVKKGTTLKDPKLHDCVTAVISAMSFPKPPDKKPQPIEYPFNLKAIQ